MYNLYNRSFVKQIIFRLATAFFNSKVSNSEKFVLYRKKLSVFSPNFFLIKILALLSINLFISPMKPLRIFLLYCALHYFFFQMNNFEATKFSSLKLSLA
jgi:hypothetical protein